MGEEVDQKGITEVASVMHIREAFAGCDKAKTIVDLAKLRECYDEIKFHYKKARNSLAINHDLDRQRILKNNLLPEIKVVEGRLRAQGDTEILSQLTVNMALAEGLCRLILGAQELSGKVDEAYRSVKVVHDKALTAYKVDHTSVDIEELHCFVEKFSRAREKYEFLKSSG